MARPCRRPRGVSLVEALVALAVMTFGMMAYVGVQSTLRFNADVAKQRTEATRIAQEAIEVWRGYVAVEADAAVVDYADIVDGLPDETLASDPGNTAYTLTRRVVDAATSPAAPRIKTLTVEVAWDDRNGHRQRVQLATTIAATPPELAGSLSVPHAGPLRTALDRHPAIPIEAVDEGTHSRFVPPQEEDGGVTWRFDDATGVIVEICTAPGVCARTQALLLSGHLRYATTPTPPTPADAESPPSPALPPAGVEVHRTAPAADTVACFTRVRSHDIRYFCAVPITVPPAGALAPGAPPGRWSGRTVLTGLRLAETRADAAADRLRVCRYTPHQDQRAVGSGTPPMRNTDHPLDYLDVNTALTNQNFLVIRAGDGAAAFDCPDDDPATPLVNGRTWHHQPP